MRAWFGDTSFFLALVSTKDRHHTRAVNVVATLSIDIVTTPWVIAEIGDALCAPHRRAHFADLLTLMNESERIILLPPSATEFESGIRLYKERRDKGWPLTDCISFSIMERLSISEALTGDSHFPQAGFRALLLED